jgi:hypothetical protein
MKKFWLGLLTVLFTSSGALAQQKGDLYGGLGYNFITYEEPGASVDLGALGFTLGSRVMNNVAIEAIVGVGVSDDTVTNVKVEINDFIGVYVRPFLAISENAEVYARLGFFRGEISASGAGLRVSSTGSDFSYGLGAAFNVSKDTAITLDYTVFYDKSSITVNGFGVGLRFNF